MKQKLIAILDDDCSEEAAEGLLEEIEHDKRVVRCERFVSETLCEHREYADGRCGEMSCWNYYSKHTDLNFGKADNEST